MYNKFKTIEIKRIKQTQRHVSNLYFNAGIFKDVKNACIARDIPYLSVFDLYLYR